MDRSLDDENQTNRTKSIDIQTSQIEDSSQSENSINRQDYKDDKEYQQYQNNDYNQQQHLEQQQFLMYNEEQEQDYNNYQQQHLNQQSEEYQDQAQSNLIGQNKDMQIQDDFNSFDYEKHLDIMKNRQPENLNQENHNINYENLKQQNQLETKSQASDPAYTILDKKNQKDFISDVSDKKIWAISGKMPGSVSKKFIRSYKLGRYNKIKSLKTDQEYFNSPHHEQLHLGNGIFPFQNNITRIYTAGSFDYRKLTQQIQNGNSQIQLKIKTSPNIKNGYNQQQVSSQQIQTDHIAKNKNKDVNSMQQVYSPRTTANTVRQQIMTQGNQQNNPNLYQQMEIKYIDIISQPIVKQSNFINNSKCPHGLTNIRNDKKNIFFMKNCKTTNTQMDQYQTIKQHKPSKTQHTLHYNEKTQGYDEDHHEIKFQDLFYNKIYKDTNNLFDEQNNYNPNSPIPTQNIIFQPKNVILNSYTNSRTQSSYSLQSRPQTTFHPGLQSKQSQRQIKKQVTQQQFQQPRLPLFAANPDNISFLPKAKQNLVKYVNQIGTQENPLKNTFVSKKKLF